MQTILPVAVVAAMIALANLAAIPEVDASETGSSIGVEPANHVPISSEIAVSPGPNSWTNTSKTTVSARILNASFLPDLRASRVWVDGLPIPLSWDDANRTVRGDPEEPLPDGTHHAEVLLYNEALQSLAGSWTFFQDTLPPLLGLDPFPAIADERVITVNGTVVESNLEEVRVNGFPAVVNGSRFLVPVILWPGRNDLLARGLDQAKNLGFAAAEVEWYPPSPENASYSPFIHANASFIVRFPSTWLVERDQELEGGFRAEIVAFAPEDRASRASVGVVSRPLIGPVNEALLLSILGDAILRITSQNEIQVVSRPTPVDLAPRTDAAQFSALDALPDGTRVFRIVTAFWSRSLSRIWLVLGSIGVETIEQDWHGIQVATESFRVVESPSEETNWEDPRTGIDRAFVVTVAAIVFVLALFAAVLLSMRPQRPHGRFPWRR